MTIWNNNAFAAAQKVRFWHKADVPITLANVCFRGNSGHHAKPAECLLLTHGGRTETSIDLLLVFAPIS